MDEELWRPKTIDQLHEDIIGSPETEGGNLIDRVEIQVSGESKLALLAAETLSVYTTFPEYTAAFRDLLAAEPLPVTHAA